MDKKYIFSSFFYGTFLLVLLVLFVIGCQSPLTPDVPYCFTFYRFNANENNAFSSDVIGTIDTFEHTVSLVVPYETDVTSLVACFHLNNFGLVWAKDTPQVSRVTPQ